MFPPTSGRDNQGANKRFGMFLEAMEGEPIHIIRLVPQAIIDAPENNPATLDEKESAYWRRDVRVTLIPRRSRHETFVNHYLAGMLRASDQKNLYPYGGGAMARALAAQLNPGTDLIYVHKLPAMCAFLQTGLKPARLFFDLDDVEHRVRFRHAIQKPVWPGKLIYATHAPALFNAERRGALLSRATFVCSPQDRDHLARLGVPRVVAVSNGVKLPPAPPAASPEPAILYIGLMTYEPNIDAARRLVQGIMPLVWRKMPEARLLLAGEGGESLRAANADPRVEYLGFVPDLDALYARAQLICCPLQNGGGTRVKLIEAAAYAKPMVSTHVGAEGLNFVEGQEILLRDDDAGLAEACLRLMGDAGLRESLGVAANRKMRAFYEQSRISSTIRAIMNGAGDAG
jgi:glycosyltransferase involved in cell wall biosynthesis